MYYIYKACTNDPMVTLIPLEDDDLVCEVCGKSATFITSAVTTDEAIEAINDATMQFSHYAKKELENMFDGLHCDSVCGTIICTKEK